MRDIVDIDPFSQLDKDRVLAAIKIEEEDEKYIVERDCPTDISQ